ncbi:MAG: hypothetical protein SF052_02765 [Bacteroidia bacterium]|nr:hypothetical protein [Bacteroidia bacterium]
MPNKGLTHIANPLYDVVFRYMMEDNRVARLFLSAVLGEEVLELVLSPTEFSKKIGGESGITVTRMDFNARVKQADGRERVILIELQKAKFYHQIMRFRNYLGKQYQNPQNVGKTGEPLPIYPVYILAESFTEEKIPVIRVIRSYTDVATQSNIAEKHPFIEALTHDATVIQAEHLQGNRRTLLEKTLSIFDQSAQTDAKGHKLALDEQSYPETYRPVIRRLHKALQNPQIEEEMDLEDEVLAELHKKDELLAAALQREEEALQREEEAKQREEEERNAKNNLIKRLFALGLSVAEIARDTGMTEVEVKKIVKN